MSSDEDREFTLTLPLSAIRIAVNHLRAGIYDNVVDLVLKICAQVNEQITSTEPSSANPAPKPDGEPASITEPSRLH